MALARSIEDNLIFAEGAKYISEGLAKNGTLKSLRLQMVEMGDEGAAHVSEALKTNSTLQTLNVSDNSFGWKGCKALSEALKVNKALETLELSGGHGRIDAGQRDWSWPN